MLVSVLIPNYNYEQYLSTTIESVLKQTYPDVELIVVDDGSTDGSREVIRSYGDQVVAVFKGNGGQTSCINAGFEHSRGELICLLDADDVFEPDKVERVVDAARGMPDASMVHHQLQIIDGRGEPAHAPFPRRVPRGDLRKRVIRAGGWFPHPVTSGLSFRRAFAERLFPIPEDLPSSGGSGRVKNFPDTYLARPAALVGPVAGIDAPLTRYRVHDENLSYTTGARPAEVLLRYQAEMEALSHVMRERFDDPVDLSIEGHLDYQRLRCATGAISRPRAAARIMRSPSLPVSMRIREALRMGANRGLAARA